MVYPDPSSEKGISAYSSHLIENIKKQGAEIEGITFFQGKPFSIFKKIPKILEYEVIHLQHEYNMLGWYGVPYFFLLTILGLFKKKSLVTTMHTVLSKNENFFGSKAKTFFRKILYKAQNKWINLSSDKIIVHSESFKIILFEEYRVPKEKILVFPHAIIENIKAVRQSVAKKELKLNGKVYLLIGTMVPDHGHDIVINNANKIGKTILIATNPSTVNYRNEEKIKRFLKLNEDIVRKNNSGKFVRFDLGFISYEKWWKYFSASDLVLLPYRGGIGSGIFADAMAVQKPVIGSNIKYFKEFAKDYGCIKLARNDEDFPRVIKEAMKPENYRKMTEECKRYLRENGLTPISKRYKYFYQSLTN